MKETQNTLKNLPDSELPYEKCERYGPSTLSDCELLAILLRTGTNKENVLSLARHLLSLTGKQGLCGLYDLSQTDLLAIHGIGKVKTIQIISVLELSKRLAKSIAKDRLTFSSPDAIARYYMEDLRHLKQEHLLLLLLDAKSGLISELTLSKGSVNSAIVSPREIFSEALKKDAVGVIMLHNHPSGDASPSEEDTAITLRILEAGKLIGIELLDHIIIGDQKFFSFHAEGLLTVN